MNIIGYSIVQFRKYVKLYLTIISIRRCAEIILEKNYHGERIVILRDSQAALKTISSLEIKSTMAVECIKMPNRVSTVHNILLAWIPGRKGNIGNELPDLLAKEAVATSPIGPEPIFAVSSHTLRKELQKEKRASRTHHWQQVPGLRQAR